MAAALLFMRYVVGGDILLLVWGMFTAGYLLCGLLCRKARGKKGRRQLLMGLLMSELLTDISCFVSFFPGGEYHNWGIGGASVVFLWPVLLLLAYGFTAAFWTRKRE